MNMYATVKKLRFLMIVNKSVILTSIYISKNDKPKYN